MTRIEPDEAVLRAFWMMNVPSMAVLFVHLLGMLVLIEVGVVPDGGPVAMAVGLATIVGAIVGGWLVWSVQVPRWRLRTCPERHTG